MNLWEGEFLVELKFDRQRQNPHTDLTETFNGSLKSAIRHYTNKYKHTHLTISFFTVRGEFIKEIGW